MIYEPHSMTNYSCVFSELFVVVALLLCQTYAAPTTTAATPHLEQQQQQPQLYNSSVNIQCDSISNYQRGRKYCIIKNVRTNENTTVTYEPSFFAIFKTEMLFDSCRMHSLPAGLFTAFPKLKTLYTWNSGLRQVSKLDFRNALELNELDLSQNKISALDDSTFFWAIDLDSINLAQNRINRLEKLTFHGLISLRTLNLANNQLVKLAPGTFDVMPRLQLLNLERNRIRSIDEKLFAKNTNLKEIHLYQNEIVHLPGHTFAHLRRLVHFDLHDNPIRGLDYIEVDSVYTNIRNVSCGGCYVGDRTEKLLAASNRISFVCVSRNASHSLVQLELAGNNLTEFKNLTQLQRLRELDVSDNQIVDIGLNAFASMTELHELRLKRSGLQTIEFGMFSHKPKLRTLDISYNRLGSIDFSMFTALPNLRTLRLEGNDLVEMDMSSIRNFFPALAEIGISKNRWTCANLALAIKVLEANHIELSAIGLTKDTSNIHGIPCMDVAALSTAAAAAPSAMTTFERFDAQMLRMVADPFDATFGDGRLQCRVGLTNGKDMKAISALLLLKQEINTARESMVNIHNKLQLILDSVSLNK